MARLLQARAGLLHSDARLAAPPLYSRAIGSLDDGRPRLRVRPSPSYGRGSAIMDRLYNRVIAPGSAVPFVDVGTYPTRTGNAVTPWIDGEPAFDRICDAIESAEHSVWA